MSLNIRPAAQCELDEVSLGECMVRLSPPGHGRLEFAQLLEVWVGGAEYNVAYALSRRSAHRLGRRSGGQSAQQDYQQSRPRRRRRYVGRVTLPFDGVGRAAPLASTLPRSALDRASTDRLRPGLFRYRVQPGDVDWKALFTGRGVRWFHTGGTFTCLSDTTREVIVEALQAAHAAGTVVSYDLNFRGKLWSSKEAIAATRPLVPLMDCLIGNEEDFQKVLGYEVEGLGEHLRELPIESYQKMVRRIAKDFPNLKVIGTTLREVLSANENSWSAILYWAETD